VDGEAQAFLKGYQDPETWFHSRWLPRYRNTVHEIEKALRENRAHDLFDLIWKRVDNAISHAGQGLLKFDVVDEMRGELIETIQDIRESGDPENFERIEDRFKRWKLGGRIRIVPHVLIARAFAGIHPHFYHTTVDTRKHNLALDWFAKHTHFTVPASTSWGRRAYALTAHLERLNAFGNDYLERNIFPWFVVDQLSGRNHSTQVSPGHVPRKSTAFASLSQDQRVMVLRHNDVQTALASELSAKYGPEHVWTEYPTGTGGYADAIVRHPSGGCYLYEIKIASTAMEVVRQAMGQLLEYSFREGGLEPVKLFIVGEPALDDKTGHFIERLRDDFNLDISYLQILVPDDPILSPQEPINDIGTLSS